MSEQTFEQNKTCSILDELIKNTPITKIVFDDSVPVEQYAARVISLTETLYSEGIVERK